MVRGKKLKKQAEDVTNNPETPVQETEAAPKVTKRFYFYDYIVVAVFFVALMFVQYWVTLWFMNPAPNSQLEQISLSFFFRTLGIGFVIVVVLVWLHDFFYRDVESEDTT